MLWWEKDELDAEIVDRDATNLLFRQTGYKVKIVSTHAVHLVRATVQSSTMQLELVNCRNTP